MMKNFASTSSQMQSALQYSKLPVKGPELLISSSSLAERAMPSSPGATCGRQGGHKNVKRRPFWGNSLLNHIRGSWQHYCSSFMRIYIPSWEFTYKITYIGLGGRLPACNDASDTPRISNSNRQGSNPNQSTEHDRGRKLCQPHHRTGKHITEQESITVRYILYHAMHAVKWPQQVHWTQEYIK